MKMYMKTKMISLTSPSLSPSSTATLSLLLQPPLHSPCCSSFKSYKSIKFVHINKRRKRSMVCRAELAEDAPFALAIGACVLNSLVFPVAGDPDEGGSGISSTDARFAVMGIISFIPYFNWLSWVFSWMDTGRQRYLVYAIVYLAPYIRTNLSLSPEESWLPLSSIIFCIAHIQLEASIMNGDIKTSELFGNALRFLSPVKSDRDANIQRHENHDKGRNKERVELPSAQEESRNRIRESGMPREPMDDAEHSTDNQEQRKD